MNTTSVLLWTILITLLYLGFFVVPAIRLKRALYQMIDHFHGLQSACLTGVNSTEELGLQNPRVYDGFVRSRDFRPYALQVLIQENVVQHENDSLCLREDKLREFMQKYRL